MPPKTAVALQFLDFDVEHNSAANTCFYDHVTVRDGDSANSTAIGSYCGEKGDLPDRPLMSTHNFMYIEFVSDSSLGGRGFKANYSTVDLSKQDAVSVRQVPRSTAHPPTSSWNNPCL